MPSFLLLLPSPPLPSPTTIYCVLLLLLCYPVWGTASGYIRRRGRRRRFKAEEEEESSVNCGKLPSPLLPSPRRLFFWPAFWNAPKNQGRQNFATRGPKDERIQSGEDRFRSNCKLCEPVCFSSQVRPASPSACRLPCAKIVFWFCVSEFSFFFSSSLPPSLPLFLCCRVGRMVRCCYRPLLPLSPLLFNFSCLPIPCLRSSLLSSSLRFALLCCLLHVPSVANFLYQSRYGKQKKTNSCLMIPPSPLPPSSRSTRPLFFLLLDNAKRNERERRKEKLGR